MMDFEKRREEIFRRSQKIIERRKKQKKLIAVFVPFVLCSFILSVTLFPDALLRKKNSPENVSSQIGSDLQFSYLNVSVEKYEYSYKKAQAEIDDKERASQIAELLHSYFEPYDVSTDTQINSSIIGDGEKEETSSSQKKGPSSTYYITIKLPKGDEKSYTLKGVNLTLSDKTITLTNAEASQLLSLLGLD